MKLRGILKHWRAATALSVSTAIVSVPLWSHLTDHNTPVPEPELTTTALPTITDQHGFQSGSLSFAFALACDNATEQYRQSCDNALLAHKLTGIDPYIMMGVEAIETNFGMFASPEGQDAQGPYQIQAQSLIHSLHTVGRAMNFYHNLGEASPERQAIDALISARPDDSIQVDHIKNGTGDEQVSAEQYEILSDLRHNPAFAAELTGLMLLHEIPEAHSDHFSNDFYADLEQRQEIITKVYLIHNQGARGAERLNDTIEEFPDQHVTLAGLSDLNIKRNSLVFNRGLDTFLDCVYKDVGNEIGDRMTNVGFQQTFETALLVSATHNQDIIDQTWPETSGAVTASITPVIRPDTTDIRITNLPDNAAEEPTLITDWERLNCGYSWGVTTSPAPPARPSDLDSAPTATTQASSIRPLMRPRGLDGTG